MNAITSAKPFRNWVPVDETPDEKAKRLGVPLIPPKKRSPPMDDDPNPIVAICGACGIECRQRMMYACKKPNCPMVA